MTRTMSISKYVNSDNNEVLCLKIAALTRMYKSYLKAYIKKEEIWCEIKTDQNINLNEQAKFIAQEAKINLDQEIINNEVVETHL